jgi:hypothetical protein
MLKILVFDIETSDMLVSTFGLRDQFIDDEQIVRDIRILAIGAKWLGQPVMYREARKPRQEKALLRWAWNLLDEADIVIGQNSKKFDSKVLTARFIVHGMNPPSPYKHLDTLIISKAVAKFPSHKLSYITKVVNKKYRKLAHSKFPGRSLWLECMAGNPKAWAEMKRYNIHDVLSTEELYLRLRAWAPANSPAVTDDRGACNACGALRLVKRGVSRTVGTIWAQYQCQECGKWQRGEKIGRR